MAVSAAFCDMVELQKSRQQSQHPRDVGPQLQMHFFRPASGAYALGRH